MSQDAKNGENQINKDAHYVLYEDLEEWLCRGCKHSPYSCAEDLMDAIIEKDRDAYMRAQAEALAWLQWLKKFAVA